MSAPAPIGYPRALAPLPGRVLQKFYFYQEAA